MKGDEKGVLAWRASVYFFLGAYDKIVIMLAKLA